MRLRAGLALPLAAAGAVRSLPIVLADRTVADVQRYQRVAAHVLDVSWNPYQAPRLYQLPRLCPRGDGEPEDGPKLLEEVVLRDDRAPCGALRFQEVEQAREEPAHVHLRNLLPGSQLRDRGH